MGRPSCTQRELSSATGCSLGAVNEAIAHLRAIGWLEPEQMQTARRTRRDYRLTELGVAELNELRSELRMTFKVKFELMQKDATSDEGGDYQ